jgi:hypothetical protein
MKCFFSISIFISLLSCQNSATESGNKELFRSDSILTTTSIDTLINENILEPINIKSIKTLDFLTTTSGVLPISETRNLCKPDTNGFFGFYSLINGKTHKYFGILKIFTSDLPKNWRDDSNNETFAAIELFGDDITLCEEIKVGMSEDRLKQFVGKSNYIKKGQLAYSNFGEYEGFFIIEDEKVKSLEVRFSCDVN